MKDEIPWSIWPGYQTEKLTDHAIFRLVPEEEACKLIKLREQLRCAVEALEELANEENWQVLDKGTCFSILYRPGDHEYSIDPQEAAAITLDKIKAMENGEL